MLRPLVAHHLFQIAHKLGVLLDRLGTVAALLDTFDRFGVLAWLHGAADHLTAWLLHLPAMLA